MKTILISGCAGYLGSIVSKIFLENGFKVVGIDNFSTSPNVSQIINEIDFYESCISNQDLITKISNKYKISCTIHLASYSDLRESFADPQKYMKNNFDNSVLFFQNLLSNNLCNFIFASSASVYSGQYLSTINEDCLTEPISPYAKSKLAFEHYLFDWREKNPLINFFILRFFNLSGSYKDFHEKHIPETHLIPKAVDSYINKSKFYLYKNDHATKDGFAIRDYIHVIDAANSILKTYELLFGDNIDNRIFNICSGKGFSNLDVMNLLEEKLNSKINYEIKKSFDSEIPSLVGDSSLAIKKGILSLENSQMENILLDNVKQKMKLT